MKKSFQMCKCFCCWLLWSNCKHLSRINGYCTSSKLCCKLESKKCFHSQIWIYSYLFESIRTHTTFAYTTAATCPTPSSTSTCTATVANPALVTNLPTVSSCYVGSGFTAATLTNQVQTACAAAQVFCQVKQNEERNLFFQ